jgi:hypothetical protein
MQEKLGKLNNIWRDMVLLTEELDGWHLNQNNICAALRPALTIRSVGTVSKILLPTVSVRQFSSPQAAQHGLEPEEASSHSSNGLLPIHIRFDSVGAALKSRSDIVLVRNTGSMPTNNNFSRKSSTALSISK